MRETDLRIGNLVTINNPEFWEELKGIPLTVFGINPAYRKEIPDSYSINLNRLKLDENILIPMYSQYLEYIEPIPLTPEWFKKLGFNKPSGSFPVYCKGNIIVEDLSYIEGENDFSVRFAVSTSLSYGIRSISYVHELQNMYWCLIGEELTIKK